MRNLRQSRPQPSLRQSSAESSGSSTLKNDTSSVSPPDSGLTQGASLAQGVNDTLDPALSLSGDLLGGPALDLGTNTEQSSSFLGGPLLVDPSLYFQGQQDPSTPRTPHRHPESTHGASSRQQSYRLTPTNDLNDLKDLNAEEQGVVWNDYTHPALTLQNIRILHKSNMQVSDGQIVHTKGRYVVYNTLVECDLLRHLDPAKYGISQVIGSQQSPYDYERVQKHKRKATEDAAYEPSKKQRKR